MQDKQSTKQEKDESKLKEWVDRRLLVFAWSLQDPYQIEVMLVIFGRRPLFLKGHGDSRW